ncbi:MAG: NFACT family protein [Pyrinomonadaceae bacterium]|nr:NFACT family protein [Pyrinomonadaceae bacterium]
MNDQIIKSIVEEMEPALVGRSMGKVFQLARLSLGFDFRTGDGRYLFLSVEPQPSPRMYLIARRVRDLEKQSLPSTSFVMTLYKRLAGAKLVALKKDENDRIVRFSFLAETLAGEEQGYTLVAQLTGRAGNLLLLDERGYVIDTLRPPRGEGQEIGDRYTPPPDPTGGNAPHASAPFERGTHPSLSEAAEDYYATLETERAFKALAANARARLKKEVTQRLKLRKHLEDDLKNHGDAETHKRIGELLLANIATAERRGTSVLVTDYYAEDTPRIELEIDEHATLQEEAARRFTRYGKARRASEEIARKLAEIEKELELLETRQSELESIVEDKDEAALDNFFGEKKKEVLKSHGKRKPPEHVPGARRYKSSDGYEILVGRAARDNDHLTFRVARPYDLWLHAADYPGSHVIILNPTRKEIPHCTIIEAAQLAASFSQARRDGKVDVHYTQRKFLSKPKGAAPGLVRMSSFRSITVEPREGIERI